MMITTCAIPMPTYIPLPSLAPSPPSKHDQKLEAKTPHRFRLTNHQ
jgi:hypothetical protein